MALLPLGSLFSAVRIPGHLLFAAAGTAEFSEVGAFLDEALDGRPVICDPRGLRYYALVPAGWLLPEATTGDDFRRSSGWPGSYAGLFSMVVFRAYTLWS
ncbi:hypothetical protein [Streptomyces sp. PTD9-10]|uniref:hypothetical protein n=1 Tax=Streptomyces sp. PTD9-10 TaxID=3120151 RepID=UPI00300B0E91